MDRSSNLNEDQQENDQNRGNMTGKKKEKRKRRVAGVLIKNPDAVNAKLETNPFTDPFFAKLNSIVGDINSSSRLMQNLISTEKGALQLRMNTPFWDPSPCQPITINEDENYENREIVCVKTLNANESHAVHHQLRGYSISDKPAEDDPDEEMPQGYLHNSLSNSSMHDRSGLNHSGAGVVFDPNAEVEPISNDNNFMIDYGAADDDHEFEQLEEEDRNAIMRCRGIRRDAVVIEDMRPVDASSSHLEYSYRPLDVISQFWAGPSHWKFRRTRSTMMKKSMSAVEVSDSARNQNASGQQVGNKRKTTRKKKQTALVTAEELFNEIPDAFVDRNPAKPLKNITYTRNHIGKKWNAKRLCLPSIIKIDPDAFDKFVSGPQLRPMNQEPEVEPELDVQQYDYNNEADNEYCRDVHVRRFQNHFMWQKLNPLHFQVETDADTETDFGGGEADNINTSDERILSPTEFQAPINQTVDIIATEFENAPEKVEKIMISYAKRAKPVDMKQLKVQCWHLMSEISKTRPPTPVETSQGEMQKIEFKEVYEKLPRVLTKSMAENISTGLVFYSLLHLANEKGLRVVQHDDLEGCILLKSDNVEEWWFVNIWIELRHF